MNIIKSLESFGIDHESQARPGINVLPDRLHVVTCVINPHRYRSRYNLYRAFAKHIKDSGAILTTVEVAFGERPFEITSPDCERHVQLRTDNELWLKENAMNVGLSRLPHHARYIACVDADFTFARPDWPQETLHQLQHHPVVQMFSSVRYLDPDGEIISTNEGFAFRWNQGLSIKVGRDRSVQKQVWGKPARGNYAAISHRYGQPGGAWAYRREALDQVGGLFDVAILGSGDTYMATASVGILEHFVQREYSEGFTRASLAWQERAKAAFRGNVGYVKGAILHGWHGKLSNRGYGKRNTILRDAKYDPDRDLKRDTQGLYRLHDDGSDRFIRLRDGIRQYFSSRNEDSIEV